MCVCEREFEKQTEVQTETKERRRSERGEGLMTMTTFHEHQCVLHVPRNAIAPERQERNPATWTTQDAIDVRARLFI